MSDFDRKISERGRKLLHSGAGETPWFRDLLMLWHPPGDELADNGQKLRLAIRNGYLNFYRTGQSVARVGFDAEGTPHAAIHGKYLDPTYTGQKYGRLKGDSAAHPESGKVTCYSKTAPLVDWITAANNKAGVEKKFVDAIVARNADIIDLEMGLPAQLGDDNAPRMDLVGLEPAGENWCVVFWEAKVMGDSRLRRRQGPPEVIEQLAAYETWMNRDGNTATVAKAYQNACRLLVEFHRFAKSVNPEISPLGRGIIEVAEKTAPAPEVDARPRLIIDDRRQSQSWAPHHAKLLKLHVQMVQCDQNLMLERLT